MSLELPTAEFVVAFQSGDATYLRTCIRLSRWLCYSYLGSKAVLPVVYWGRCCRNLAEQDNGSSNIPAAAVRPEVDADVRRWAVYDAAEDEAVEPAGGGDAAWTKTIISSNRSDMAGHGG